jgi:hypothetical protein
MQRIQRWQPAAQCADAIVTKAHVELCRRGACSGD